MPYIAPEVVQEVKRMDLLTYLKNYEPYELVHFSGNTYTTKTHDSLKISNGKWMWWRREYLLSLAGVYQLAKEMEKSRVPATLTCFLTDNMEVREVVLHLDNDRAGRLAAQAKQTVLPGKYQTRNEPPERGKDCNDWLCLRLGIEVTKRAKKQRERNGER